MRYKTVFSTVLAGLLATWLTLCLPAGAAQGVLCQESLRGSMQGQAVIALNLNGDNYEDLVIGAPYAQDKDASGRLLVYLGSAAGLPARPSISLAGEGNLGCSLAVLGDLDRDGKPYFAAGALNGSSEVVSLAGTVTIYKGGRQPQKVAVLSGESAMDKFGCALAVGDLNGDGCPDLIVGAPFHSPDVGLYQKGAVYVYFGSKTPPYYDPGNAVKISATSTSGGLGFSVAAGDVNGDGVDDLLLQASGKVLVFYGSGGHFAPAATSPDVAFSSATAGFGKSLAVIPDLSGDGCKEMAIGADQATVDGVADSGCLFLLKGVSSSRTVNVDLPAPEVLAKINGEANGGRFGSLVLPLREALAVSAVQGPGNPWPVTGKIFVFDNGSLLSGAPMTSAQAFPGAAPDMHLGGAMAFLAARGQLAAGAPMVNANTGGVWLFNLR